MAFDGAEPDPGMHAWIAGVGGRAVVLPERRGPAAARNAAARIARGEWLAFTEDDCAPAPDWLERAAARIARDPSLEVVEGETLTPSGRPVRRRDRGLPTWLPTNLFLRRALYDRAGGYREDYFDPARGLYFREDSDFGFRLEETGARIALEPRAIVVHPDEHPRFLDPLRWARRYEMDALLEARHPERFRSRIEVARLGPLTLRRVVLRASFGYVLALLAGAAALALGELGVALGFLILAAISFLPVWAKWRFHPARLPIALLVPFVLITAIGRGHLRARRLPA